MADKVIDFADRRDHLAIDMLAKLAKSAEITGPFYFFWMCSRCGEPCQSGLEADGTKFGDGLYFVEGAFSEGQYDSLVCGDCHTEKP